MKTVVWCTIRKLEGILSIADFSLEVNLKNFGFQCDISQFSNFDHIIMDLIAVYTWKVVNLSEIIYRLS